MTRAEEEIVQKVMTRVKEGTRGGAVEARVLEQSVLEATTGKGEGSAVKGPLRAEVDGMIEAEADMAKVAISMAATRTR